MCFNVLLVSKSQAENSTPVCAFLNYRFCAILPCVVNLSLNPSVYKIICLCEKHITHGIPPNNTAV